MLRIYGTEQETDNVIEALTLAGCETCPALQRCRHERLTDQPDDGRSCGEVIRECVELVIQKE